MQEIHFQLRTEYIELSKLLKATGLCDDGAMAKDKVREGLAKVDGVVEMRPGKKVYPGQKVDFDQNIILVESEK